MNTPTTRDKILHIAYEEFHTHGYTATGLKRLLEKAGIQKGSLYHFFPSKKALGLAVVDEIIAERFERRYAHFQNDPDPIRALLAFISDPDNFDLKRGCPLGKLIQELAAIDADFQKALDRVFRRYESHLKAALDHAVTLGKLPPQDTGRLALFIGSVLSGAIQRATLGGDPALFTQNIAVLKTLLSQPHLHA